MTEHAMLPILAKLAAKQNLNSDEATRGFQLLMNGGATPAQIAAFLTCLKLKGETVEEIAAGATVLRLKAPKFSIPEGAMDVCGTGGDGKGSLNVSTAVGLVVAACGVPVVKHGNRGVSSKSGSADVLAELGIKIDAELPEIERSLKETNFCFLLAPKFHTAMRQVAPVRQELGFRTVFNLLGPLANPAQPKHQLVGVYSRELLEPIANVLKILGVQNAWVVCGGDGLDELTPGGVSNVVELKDRNIAAFTVSPEDAGLPTHGLNEIMGGDIEYNAEQLKAVLQGTPGAYRDTVILNAAAALVVAGKAVSLAEGATIAANAIDSSNAIKTLYRLTEISNSFR